ncbi:MAG: type IV pilin protein [Gallionella sp.]
MTFAKGFTLIEIMIVVALIGILSAIAIPYYGDYVTRGKIPDATSNLAAKRVLMEQFFQDNHSYLSGASCPPSVGPDSSSSKYFTFTCSNMNTDTYTITATGKNPGTMAGFTYTIDQSNTKTSAIGAPAKSKWVSISNNCWITNTGGQC